MGKLRHGRRKCLFPLHNKYTFGWNWRREIEHINISLNNSHPAVAHNIIHFVFTPVRKLFVGLEATRSSNVID
jgi:hypothetical protein